MRRRSLIAVAGVIALGAPALVIAGNDDAPIYSNLATSGGQTIWQTDGSTATRSRAYKPVRGLATFIPAHFDYDPGSTVQVTVDLRGGKAKLRLRDADSAFGGQTITPGSVLVAGRGIGTATFLVRAGVLNEPVVEWKRLGKSRVKAASVVASTVGPND